MLNRDYPLNEVAEVTGLSIEEIQRLSAPTDHSETDGAKPDKE